MIEATEQVRAKAVRLADRLKEMTRFEVVVTAEDVLMKCSCEEELNFYYYNIVGKGR